MELTQEMKDKFKKIVHKKIELRSMKEELDSMKRVHPNDARYYNLKLETYIHALEELHSIIFEEVLEEMFNGFGQDEEAASGYP